MALLQVRSPGASQNIGKQGCGALGLETHTENTCAEPWGLEKHMENKGAEPWGLDKHKENHEENDGLSPWGLEKHMENRARSHWGIENIKKNKAQSPWGIEKPSRKQGIGDLRPWALAQRSETLGFTFGGVPGFSSEFGDPGL